jgi:hypothetical protein
MKHRSIALCVVSAAFAVAACGGSSDASDEPLGETTSKLDSSGDGCIIANPVCAVRPAFAHGDFQPDSLGDPSPPACMDRARQWSVWCANPPGISTAATFLVGGQPVAQTVYTQQIPTHCITNLAECDAYPTWAGSFGDDWLGSYTDPGRCMSRPKEWSDFCHNHTGVVLTSTFDGPGVHLDGAYAAP